MSLNDPKWGNSKKPEGPPDLDEIFRKLNQKLAGLFGGKSNKPPENGGGTPKPALPAGAIFTLLAVAMGVIFVGWLATGFYTVKDGTKAAVLKLGKYNRTTEAGLNWRWPRPIESEEIVDVSNLRSVEIGFRKASGQDKKQPNEALMLTEDENIVDVQLSVQYDVSNIFNFLFRNNMGTKTLEEDTIRQIAETAIREVVGRSKMDFVLNEGRTKIATDVKSTMQQIADRYELGVSIRTVNLADTQPPEAVRSAFDDFVRAGQQRETYKNEGEAYRNDKLPRAKGAAQRLLEESEGHRGRVVANAEGEAARFKSVLTEYEKAPQVTRERLYLETMQQVLSNTNKVLIDNKSGSGNMLYLPLDKLAPLQSAPTKQGTVEMGSSSSSRSADTPPAPVVAEPSRREQLRSR